MLIVSANGAKPKEGERARQKEMQHRQTDSSGKKNANSTRCSRAVTHHSTNPARLRLTSVIGREPVHSQWYDRWRKRCPCYCLTYHASTPHLLLCPVLLLLCLPASISLLPVCPATNSHAADCPTPGPAPGASWTAGLVQYSQ